MKQEKRFIKYIRMIIKYGWLYNLNKKEIRSMAASNSHLIFGKMNIQTVINLMFIYLLTKEIIRVLE